jgi:hypothetical protein
VIGRRFGPNAWGDFVHQLSRGEIERPPEAKHWRDVKALLDARFIEVDPKDIRKAWKDFEGRSSPPRRLAVPAKS